MDEGGCCLLVVLGMVVAVGGGGYYAYSSWKQSEVETAQRRQAQRRTQYLECLTDEEKLPKKQPELDGVLGRCTQICRDDSFWRREDDVLYRSPSNKRRAVVCWAAARNLIRFRDQTYIPERAREIHGISCKYGGLFPEQCRDQFAELESDSDTLDTRPYRPTPCLRRRTGCLATLFPGAAAQRSN